MFTALIISTLTLTGGEITASEAPRAFAAELLRERLSALETIEGGQDRFRLLVRAANEVSESLGKSAFADDLQEIVYMARWSALTEPRKAELGLELDLEQALSDLIFEPLIESELPEGFPMPTALREIELKSYPVYRLARADMEVVGENGAFWKLFNHITKHDFAMTSPVEMTYDDAGDEVDMAFMYGRVQQGSSGLDGEVAVMDIDPMLVASLGCRGRSSQRALDGARAQLLAWIEKREDIEVSGPMRQFGYNSPMVPRSRRYFEIQIPVTKIEMLDEVVIDFGSDQEVARWVQVNDSVMGGRSTSRIVPTSEGTSFFTGDLSLENNGGFASVRSERSADADLRLEGAEGLVVRARGDGKTYKLRLRMDGRFNSVSYEARFRTIPGEWTETRFEFSEFKPTWRGRDVRDAPELDPARVQGVTLMLSDKQEGPFRVELDKLAKF
jgi:NADH dehydrogenase [ubiquinone] 1 alpha subcomplex assembly factor 1